MKGHKGSLPARLRSLHSRKDEIEADIPHLTSKSSVLGEYAILRDLNWSLTSGWAAIALYIGGAVKNDVIERSLLYLRNCAKSNFGISRLVTRNLWKS